MLSIDPRHALQSDLLAQPQLPIGGSPDGWSTPGRWRPSPTAPALRELLALSTIRNLLAGHHDTVVLDAPGTGHAIGMLEVPRTLQRIARVGPVRQRAENILLPARGRPPDGGRAGLHSRGPGLSETLDAWERLATTHVPCAGTIANGVLEPLFEAGDEAALAVVGDGDGPAARAAVAAAHARMAQTAAERELLRRLPSPLAELPLIQGDLPPGRAEAAELAGLLEGL